LLVMLKIEYYGFHVFAFHEFLYNRIYFVSRLLRKGEKCGKKFWKRGHLRVIALKQKTNTFLPMVFVISHLHFYTLMIFYLSFSSFWY